MQPLCYAFLAMFYYLNTFPLLQIGRRHKTSAAKTAVAQIAKTTISIFLAGATGCGVIAPNK